MIDADGTIIPTRITTKTAKTRYNIYAIRPGYEPRLVTSVELEPGEWISVNREDVPQPSLRASMVANGMARYCSQAEVRQARKDKQAMAVKYRIGGHNVPSGAFGGKNMAR
jgi:hypothetical protein